MLDHLTAIFKENLDQLEVLQQYLRKPSETIIAVFFTHPTVSKQRRPINK